MNDTEDAFLIAFEVAADEAGERLDKVVARRAGALGRRRVADIFERGAVRVEGKRSKKGDRARAGQAVTVRGADVEPIRAEPEAQLDVRLETATILVVNKPAGQPTAPLRPGEEGTLAAALLGRYPELAGIGYRAREPGLLHRLDTQTSGLVVAVRSAPAFEHLRQKLSQGFIDKRYLAIVEARNLAAEGVVDRPLIPDPSDKRRVVVAPPYADRPRRALTRWRRIREVGQWALLEVEARHAYRHQVRVHLAAEGHPIAGDLLYGGPPSPLLGTRHALHASYVEWPGDEVLRAFTVTAPLPSDLEALFDAG